MYNRRTNPIELTCLLQGDAARPEDTKQVVKVVWKEYGQRYGAVLVCAGCLLLWKK